MFRAHCSPARFCFGFLTPARDRQPKGRKSFLENLLEDCWQTAQKIFLENFRKTFDKFGFIRKYVYR
ncbi:MAG: hypothetical protein BJG00_011605 [Limnothrix sp. CACIAM 69d]|nr:MAG: hypothetical protein BJG00_011605 [Limnothrix sp. CACIAM 69d]